MNDDRIYLETDEGFKRFKDHLKHNVYAVVWSAWMAKDKSSVTDEQAYIIFDRFIRSYSLLVNLTYEKPNDFKEFIEFIDEIRALIE